MNPSLTPLRHWIGRAAWGALTVLLASCGGGGSSSPSTPAVTGPTLSGSNVQTLRVNAGPPGMSASVVNLLYTSVRVCQPDTTTCQTIDHVLVDTGSTGLRLLKSALTLPLAPIQIGGKSLYNCVQFLDDSYMWGPVVKADVHMGGTSLDGEKAANLPIQLVGVSGAPAAPDTCAPTGYRANDSVNAFGANGILGVGTHEQDCGETCTRPLASGRSNGYYFLDAGGGTTSATAADLVNQVQHPVRRFASENNNGVVISLPAVPAGGAATVSGSMMFGIGTQANNTPAAVRVMAPNAAGYFSTTFQGRILTKGFVDSGSNGWFFGTATLPLCTDAPQWYCPAGSVALQAFNASINGQTSTVDFSVANARTLFSNTSAYALSNLAGPIGDETSFDFGLPFFFGRTVYTAIEGAATSLGKGPYVAY